MNRPIQILFCIQLLAYIFVLGTFSSSERIFLSLYNSDFLFWETIYQDPSQSWMFPPSNYWFPEGILFWSLRNFGLSYANSFYLLNFVSYLFLFWSLLLNFPKPNGKYSKTALFSLVSIFTFLNVFSLTQLTYFSFYLDFNHRSLITLSCIYFYVLQRFNFRFGTYLSFFFSSADPFFFFAGAIPTFCFYFQKNWKKSLFPVFASILGIAAVPIVLKKFGFSTAFGFLSLDFLTKFQFTILFENLEQYFVILYSHLKNFKLGILYLLVLFLIFPKQKRIVYRNQLFLYSSFAILALSFFLFCKFSYLPSRYLILPLLFPILYFLTREDLPKLKLNLVSLMIFTTSILFFFQTLKHDSITFDSQLFPGITNKSFPKMQANFPTKANENNQNSLQVVDQQKYTLRIPSEVSNPLQFCLKDLGLENKKIFTDYWLARPLYLLESFRDQVEVLPEKSFSKDWLWFSEKKSPMDLQKQPRAISEIPNAKNAFYLLLEGKEYESLSRKDLVKLNSIPCQNLQLEIYRSKK